MSAYFDRRYGIGCAVGIVSAAALLAIAALLMENGTIAERTAGGAVCVSAFLGTFLGCLEAAGKTHRLARSLLCALGIYLVLWLTALASAQPICFGTQGATVSVCVLCGGLAAGLMLPGNHGKHTQRARRKTNRRTGVSHR